METKARGKISKWGEILKIVKIFVMLFFLSSMFAGQAFADDHDAKRIIQNLRSTEILIADYYDGYEIYSESPKLTELNCSWIRGEQVLTKGGKKYVLLENGDIISWEFNIYAPNNLIGGDGNATQVRWIDEPMDDTDILRELDRNILILKIIGVSMFGIGVGMIIMGVWAYWRG